MLAHQNIVVLYASERVSIGLARTVGAARAWPGWRGDLHYEAVAVRVPGQHALGVAVRLPLGLRGVAIELVVPQHIEECSVIHLAERSSHRIVGGVADAAAAYLQCRRGAAGVNDLLAEFSVLLNRSAKRTRSLSAGAATGKGPGIEFEYEPPFHGMPALQKGLGWTGLFRRL